jgi:hypothetical protein
MPETLTLEEAKTKIALFTKLTPKDVDDLLDPSLTQDDLETMIRAYVNAGKAADKTSWDIFLQVLGCVVQVANAIVPISSAVNSVLGVVTTAKSL